MGMEKLVLEAAESVLGPEVGSKSYIHFMQVLDRYFCPLSTHEPREFLKKCGDYGSVSPLMV
jgi:hypothetical protein